MTSDRAALKLALRAAKDDLRKRIGADASGEEIKAAFEAVKTLEEIDGRRRRWFDLLVLIASVGIAAAICGIASFIHASNPAASLSAKTTSFTVETAMHSQGSQSLPLIHPIAVTSLSIDQMDPPKPLCTSPQGPVLNCEIVQSISMTTLKPTPGMKIRFDAQEKCLLARVVQGYLRLEYRVFRAGVLEAQAQDVILSAKDTLQLCAAAPPRLMLFDVQRMTVASWNDVPAAYVPSLTGGSIEFSEFAKQVSLGKNDKLTLEFTAGPGPMSMELLGSQFSIDIAGKPAVVTLTDASGPHDERPVWLDWLLGSPTLHGILSLVLGLFAFAWSVREKLVR